MRALEGMHQRILDEVGNDLAECARIAVEADPDLGLEIEAIGRMLEAWHQRHAHLLQHRRQVEDATPVTGLVDRHLLEVLDQVGGADEVAFEQVVRFAYAGDEAIEYRTPQLPAGDRLLEFGDAG